MTQISQQLALLTPAPRFCHGLASVGRHLVLLAGTGSNNTTYEDAFAIDTEGWEDEDISTDEKRVFSTEATPASEGGGASAFAATAMPTRMRWQRVVRCEKRDCLVNPGPRNGFTATILGDKVCTRSSVCLCVAFFNKYCHHQPSVLQSHIATMFSTTFACTLLGCTSVTCRWLSLEAASIPATTTMRLGCWILIFLFRRPWSQHLSIPQFRTRQ